MKIFVVIAALVAVVRGQYDYPLPNRGFTEGGTTERPIYGLPNHVPGTPIGPSGIAGPAPATPPARRPSHSQQNQAQTFSQQNNQAQTFSQQQNQPQTFSPQQNQAQTFSQQQNQPQTFSPQQNHAQTFSQQAPQQNQNQEAEYTPKLFRHIYVHSAPDEPEDRQSRTVRVPGGDKHVNIIFVKTPSSSSSHQTEVILPEQDEHKNLVYVLLKKGENTADVKIRKPAPAAPKKPEVYFIRYGAQQTQGSGGYQQQGNGQHQQQQSQGNGGYQQAPAGIQPPAPITSEADIPSSGYGLPL